MKLALDVWYEAWGRTGEREVAGATGHGEARVVEKVFRDGTRGDRGGLHWGEVAGDIGPPPYAGP